MPNETKAIHVDYEINRRDLFRVSLELEKWRLIVGLLVCVILIAGAIYFFLLIDEGKCFYNYRRC
jgi:hypothetical protein